jgi:FAD binding domain-containing protein
MVAQAWHSVFPRCRLGGARRSQCDRTRQLRAAIPRHLEPGRVSSRLSSIGCERPQNKGWSPSSSVIVSMSSLSRARRSMGCAGTSLSQATWSAARRARATSSAHSSSGIGANHDLVRKNWPKRLGEPPERMITGVPDHVDGRMLAITEAAGGNIINRDRMWHYVEGIKNWSPIWTAHAIRILPGPSSFHRRHAFHRLDLWIIGLRCTHFIERAQYKIRSHFHVSIVGGGPDILEHFDD